MNEIRDAALFLAIGLAAIAWSCWFADRWIADECQKYAEETGQPSRDAGWVRCDVYHNGEWIQWIEYRYQMRQEKE